MSFEAITMISQAEETARKDRARAAAEAMSAAEALREQTEKQKAAMRAAAEQKLDEAAMLIVERIVNS